MSESIQDECARLTRERDEAKLLNSMLMDVLLGIGAMYGLSVPEMAEDPSLIVLRIEQSLSIRAKR